METLNINATLHILDGYGHTLFHSHLHNVIQLLPLLSLYLKSRHIIVVMDNQRTTQVTVSDPFLGVMEMSFTYRSDVQHADERETHTSAISSAVMKYIAEHDHLDLTGYSKKNLVPLPLLQENGNTICISKNTLHHMYDEWLQFTQLRDECVANMQEQLKQLKPTKPPSFVAFCETHLDVTKHVFECETCGFHAKNPRALSAHRKGKNCVQLRTNHVSDTASSEYDENEAILKVSHKKCAKKT